MKHIFCLLFAVFLTSTVMAQTPRMNLRSEEIDSSKDGRIYLIHTAKDTMVYEILKKDRPKSFRDTPVPHFAIHTGDNSFILTIGGKLQPIIGWDLGNDLYEEAGAAGGFITNQIPVPAKRFKKSDFYINALNANLTLQIVGFGGTDNQISGFFKIGTDGYKNPLKLKLAYVKWRGFAAGMKKTLFEDEDANMPSMIDPQGPAGAVDATNYLFNYESPSFNGFRAAIGIEIPTFNTSDGRYLGKDYKQFNGQDILNKPVVDPTAYNQLVPDIPAYLEWARDGGNRIRLSGILRTLNYRDVLHNRRRTTVGWGVQLSGNWTPLNQLSFFGQAVYGKGIGNYILDLAGIPLSFTPKSSDPGRLTSTPEMGLVFGFTYNIGKRWQMNAVYSMSRMWNVGPYALSESESGSNPDEFNNYRYSNYVGANVFYQISSFFQVGAEYLYGQRHTYYRGQAHDNRISFDVCFLL